MTPSTLELTLDRQSVCPHCGPPTDRVHRYRWIETGLGILAMAALAFVLLPLGIVAWKACTNRLSEGASHSILFQPLEDWTRYSQI